MLLRFLYRALKARFRDQTTELKALVEAIRPGDIAVDIGAHKGSHLLWLSRAVRSGRVVAFEPQPRLADQLRRVCRAAHLKNVVVEAAGISQRGGNLTLHIPGEGDSPGASFEQPIQTHVQCRDVTVPVFSLDDYFRDQSRRIAAMKVDVEGHELSVFRGAERLLEVHGPLLVFECENRHLAHGCVGDVLHYLKERRYDGVFVRRSELVPLHQFDPSIHQKQTGDRFWDSEDYCNNFIMSRVG